jgi:hypothetical protein
MKSRRMRWAGNVAPMEEERKVYRFLVGKPDRKRPLGRLVVVGLDHIASWGDWLGRGGGGEVNSIGS